jgi:glycosyltransferase EpsF
MLGQNLPKLRVLHVLDNLGMGGAETWLMELLRFWHRQGPDGPQLDFLATGGAPSYYDREAEALGATVHYLRYGRRHLSSFVSGFRKILRQGTYAAIHDHGDYVSGWHFFMAGGALPRVRVTHIHNPAFHIRTNYGTTSVRRLTSGIGKALIARYATHIAGTSRQVISEYGFDEKGFERIPKMALHCGFDPSPIGNIDLIRFAVRREFGWPEDSKIVLFAGRIDASPDIGHPRNHKNSGFAISVAIEAAQRDPRVRMVLVGSLSPAVQVLQHRVAKAGVAGRIYFVGIRRDLKRLMYASDILLFPSRGEGLGMVAVEAQAAGLPVLASKAVPRECVVIPELMRFEALEQGTAEWATALLTHAGRRHDVAAASRRVAKTPFAIDNSARALVTIYKQGLAA